LFRTSLFEGAFAVGFLVVGAFDITAQSSLQIAKKG
jgi:hypothetical protein